MSTTTSAVRRAFRRQPRSRATHVAVDPGAARSRWIEAFYVAEAKAQLEQQAAAGRRSAR